MYDYCTICGGLAINGVCEDCGAGEGWQKDASGEACDNCDNCGACTAQPLDIAGITEDMFYVDITAQVDAEGEPLHPEYEGDYITVGLFTRNRKAETKLERVQRETAEHRNRKEANYAYLVETTLSSEAAPENWSANSAVDVDGLLGIDWEALPYDELGAVPEEYQSVRLCD